MDEYIKREAAQTSCRKYSFAESYDAFAVDCILKAIPAADVAPVVRCKDCRKFKTYSCRMVASGYDDFCSYGERKDGGDAT